MRYQLSDDQAMIRDAVGRFTDAEVLPRAYDWDAAASAPSSVIAALAELGLMGMRTSEASGGAALDPVAALIAIETLAGGDGGLAWAVARHNLLALPLLEASGHEAVAALSAGEGVATWFDGPVKGEIAGEQARLTGVAPLVPWGRQCHLMVGRLPGEQGPTWVAVSPDADGVRASATEGAMGLRSAALATVNFESAPATVLSASTSSAIVDAWARLARAAVGLGVAQGALQAATRYAQERHQFKRPIAQFQAVQWMLAETATEIDAGRLLVWSAVGPDGTPRVHAAAQASLYALPAASRAGMRAVQVYGGNGYVREYPVERCLRDAKALEVMSDVDADHDRILEALVARP